MENQNTQIIFRVADEITRYIVRHPNAADSIEGITTWWLTQQRYETTIDNVQHALDLLVASGKLLKSAAADGKVIYSLRSKKKSDQVFNR